MVFDPATLSNKTLWLRAKDLGANGSSVTAWSDQSGVGNDVISVIGTAPTVNGTGGPLGGKTVAFSAGALRAPTVLALYHAEASTTFDGNRWAGRCFDGRLDTVWSTATGNVTGWVSFRKIDNSTFVLTAYSVTANGAQAPKNWTFEGSANGSSWTVLDTQTNQTFAGTVQKDYTFTNPTPYKFYRINISANNGDANNTSIYRILPGGLASAATACEFWATVWSNATPTFMFAMLGASVGDLRYPYSDSKWYDDGIGQNVVAFSTTPSVLGWHTVRIVQKNPGREWWIDGKLQYSDTGVWGAGDGVQLGRVSSGNFIGRGSEFLARSVVSTQSDQNNLWSYFAAEQGTPSLSGIQPIAAAQIYANVGAANPPKSLALSQIYANVLYPDSADDGIWDASSLTPQADGSAVTAWPAASGGWSGAQAGSAGIYKVNQVAGKPAIRFGGSTGYDTNMLDGIIDGNNNSPSFTIMAVVKPAATGTNTIVCGKGTGPQLRVDTLRPVVNNGGNYALFTDATLPQISSTAYSLVTARFVNGLRYRTVVSDRVNGIQVARNVADGQSQTYWEATSIPTTPAWVRVEPPDGLVAAASYTLTPLTGWSTRMPTAFKLQGSNSVNGPWADIDSRTGISWTNAAQTFTTGSTTAYRYYRLYVTATGDGVLDLVDFQINAIPVRNFATEVRVNGATYGQQLRDHASLVQFNSVVMTIGYRNGAGSESFNGDITYVRITMGEVDIGSIVARENALMTTYGITPADTSNTSQPMKQAKATSNAGNGWQEALLMDHQGGGNGAAWSAGAQSPQTVVFDSLSKAVVKNYWMQARSDSPGSAPKDWLLQGSNDGTTWTTVDTRTGLSWVASEKKNFTVATPTEYAYYRIVISATSDGVTTTWPAIAEMDLTGATTIPPPVIDKPAGGVLVTEGFTLFGLRYAAGDPMPVGLSASIQRSLQRRGRLSSGGVETIRKAVNINGTALAAGAAAPTGLTPRQARVLERGKIIVGDDDV